MTLLLYYVFFIVYGSLIPFDFNGYTFEQACRVFGNIPWLALGMYSRADWIANILLYIPFSYLLANALAGKSSPASYRLLAVVIAVLLGFVLALAIEFCQVFFPPRTVSLNDLLAETLGLFIGSGLWLIVGGKVDELFKSIVNNSRQSQSAFITLYTVFYLFLSFFPFDFVTSADELHKSISAKSIGFFSGIVDGDGVVFVLKACLEVFAAVPLGFFIASKFFCRRIGNVFLLAFSVSALLEVLQLLLITGTFQGVSIIARGAGVCFGACAANGKLNLNLKSLRIEFLRFLPIVFFIYLVVVLSVNGWSLASFTGYQNGLAKIAQINWLPFYYHYYVTEAVALTSVMYVVVTYLPLGVGYAFIEKRLNVSYIVVAAVFLALLVEFGKLFFSVKHPDPSNFLIAGFSAYFGFYIVNVFKYAEYGNFSGSVKNGNMRNTQAQIAYQSFGSLDATDGAENQVVLSTPRSNTDYSYGQSNTLGKSIALAVLFFVFWKAGSLPAFTLQIVAFLVAYATAVWLMPQAWLVLLPTIVPLIDLSPFSGRFFFAEVDLVVLTTFAVSLLRNRWVLRDSDVPGGLWVLTMLLVSSLLISLLAGLYPFDTVDDNSFINYYSRYNALRVFRGFFWALILFPVLVFSLKRINKAREYLCSGILLGLLVVCLVAIWERFLYSGLFNYDTDFRITASFASMHTGGGHIDEYLVLVVPFIATQFFGKQKAFRSVFALVLLTLSAYTILVTFSRGPYIAFMVEAVLLCVLFYTSVRSNVRYRLGFILAVAVAITVLLGLSVPVLKGDFIQKRFSQVEQDYYIRTSHWLDAINMMDSGIATSLFGMGLGSYPRTYFWRNSENTIPATYSLATEGDGHYLKLGGGDSLYVEQRVPVAPDTEYKLSFEARSESSNAMLTIPICEKALLYSFDCIWDSFNLAGTGNWQKFEKIVKVTSIGAPKGKLTGTLSKRATKLGLYNGISQTVLDVRNVSLVDAEGNDLVKNGGFSHGFDYWFFSTDNHLPWHIKNIWVQMFFDLGWFGLLVFSCFVTYILIQSFKSAVLGDRFSLAATSGLVGFLVVGVVDSPFDEPRLTFMFLLVCWFSILSRANNA
ncbi:VanZ family protein [Methylomonas sp. EFPC3]|uniref:VanZ family protein n=1 Tax=Methylomonas sp. EFPC3 TaxID=3021710 RepID=UPI002417F92E|nr:VanZ family protein [Methylomonas sp. EFPC3]WFP50744.1 VanZ family protein [Methylomonas sp. EFPC3]